MTIGNFPKPLHITLLLIALTVVLAAANCILSSNPEPPALTTMGLEAEQDFLMPPMVINSTADTGPTPTPPAAGGRQFYVSPQGRPNGNGSIGNPWGLNALVTYGVVPAGATVYLRGGTFDLDFTPNVYPDPIGHKADETKFWMAGNPTSPIIVRPYPGERVKFDADWHIYFNGNYVQWNDIEFMDSKQERVSPGGWGWPQAAGISVNGEYVKFINCAFYNLTKVLNFRGALGVEYHGCLFYYIGNVDGSIPPPGAPWGTASYIQNESTIERKWIDNIFFSNQVNHVQAYGGETAMADNLTFEGNTFFNVGKLYAGSTGIGFDLGVGVAVRNLKFNSNYSYNDGRVLNFLGKGGEINFNLEMKNNRIATDGPLFFASRFEPMVFTGNNLYSRYKIITYWVSNPSSQTWNKNTYNFLKGNDDPWTRIPFTYNDQAYEFAGWKAASGFDANSTYTVGRPTGTEVYIRPNAYAQGRANITVFNWGLAATANVNLATTGLVNGQQYQIKDVQDFFGPSIYSGVYSSTSPIVTITLPGTGSPVTPWVGANNAGNNGYWVPPVHTSKEFNAFVLLPR